MSTDIEIHNRTFVYFTVFNYNWFLHCGNIFNRGNSRTDFVLYRPFDPDFENPISTLLQNETIIECLTIGNWKFDEAEKVGNRCLKWIIEIVLIAVTIAGIIAALIAAAWRLIKNKRVDLETALRRE